LLKESIQKWRQIETCTCELRVAVGSGGDVRSVERICDESTRAFEAAMCEDMNTPLAVSELAKFATKLNRYIAADKLTKDMAVSALPTLTKMMYILGLKILETSDKERKEIEEIVLQRNRLRAEKKFKEADEIRKKLLERSVELLDHKGRTVWVKRENPE
jgi:cysteinyl-tRNA synthetase